MRSKPNRRERNMICEICGQWHDSISQLSACLTEYEEEIDYWQSMAESEAEMRNERWFEERGGWQDDLGEDMRRNPFDPIWQM